MEQHDDIPRLTGGNLSLSKKKRENENEKEKEKTKKHVYGKVAEKSRTCHDEWCLTLSIDCPS